MRQSSNEVFRSSKEASQTMPFDAPLHTVRIIGGDGKNVVQECGGSRLTLANITRDHKGNGWPRFGDCPNCRKPFMQTKKDKLVKEINGDIYSLHVQTEETILAEV